ncbi:Multidrug resistance-associated protein 1 [Nymphon striatum]|nr:Multidrug resistance-associated protein 1 [Nymphon striatum]
MSELTELQLGRRRRPSPICTTNYQQCIICQKTTLESLQSLTGYGALSYAVSHRGDDAANRLIEDIQCKDTFLAKEPKYHSRCRNRYTNKKCVEQKKRARIDSGDLEETEALPPDDPLATRSNSVKLNFKKVCFVCEKERDKRGDRKLNDNTSWNTPVPQFSYCLQDTFCVWIPASIFLLLIPWEVHRHKKKRTWEVDWSVRIIIRCVVISIIIALNLIALILAVYRNISGYDTSLSEIIGTLISIVVQIMTLSLTIISKKRGIVTSPSQFYYWLLNTVAELLKYYSLISELLNQPQNPELSRLIITLAALPLSLLVFLCNILPDRINLKSVKQESLNNIGFHLASASYVKQILFAWVFPIIRLGNRKTITKDEVWTLRPSHKTDFLYKKFLYNWKKEQRSCLEYNMKNPGKNKKPGIIIALIKSFWRDLAFGTSIRLTLDLFQYINPVLLNILISFISSNEPTWKGVLYSIAIAAVIYIRETVISHYFDKQTSLCVRIKGALTMAIYKKGLLLSNSARQSYSIGSMVNLLAVDLQKFQDLVLYVPQLWMAPIIIIVGIIQLWGVLGISCLSGIAVIVFFIPYSFIFTKTENVYQEHVMHLSDKRLKVTNEVLTGVKVLKLYAWENPFKDTIKDIRSQEVKMIIGCIMSQSATETAWQNVPILISLASFATYVYIDKNNVLTPNVAFVSIALFNLIKVPMMLFPVAFSSIVEARVSIKRIDKFLNSEELSDFDIKQDTYKGHQLSIENGFFSWDSSDKNSILENINIKVKPGELVAVVGKVGSGKSSLISSLLGEMHLQQGKVYRKGSIAYVPQVAWIQNNTVQQNIIFTSEFKKRKYNKIIDACALRPDFDIMIAGDQTEIGEKGVNISGGQKQRISLARAVYSDAEIYFLDDTLSAVDAHVGTHIFKEVLGPEGILKSKTRFMTTNSLTFLPECDQIIVLINGKISETGKYSELVQKSGAFAELVLQYASEDNRKETVQNLEAFESILEDKNVPEEFKRTLSHEVEELENRSVRSRTFTGSLSADHSICKQASMNKKGKLIDEEEMETGSVSLDVYWTYIKQLGVPFAIAAFVSYFITEGSSVLSNIWLSLWSDQSSQDSMQHSNGYWLGIYAGFVITSSKENIWCKYYLLRQYSSSSSAGESSTLMATDDCAMSSSSTSNNDGVVLLQPQVWMGNTLPPTEWGCRSHDGTLTPVETDMPVAPESLLNMVSCGCKPDGCSNMTCSCNKLGLFCTSTCSKCSGQTCNNTTPSLLDVDDEDIAPSSVVISVEDSPADDEDEY